MITFNSITTSNKYPSIHILITSIYLQIHTKMVFIITPVDYFVQLVIAEHHGCSQSLLLQSTTLIAITDHTLITNQHNLQKVVMNLLTRSPQMYLLYLKLNHKTWVCFDVSKVIFTKGLVNTILKSISGVDKTLN